MTKLTSPSVARLGEGHYARTQLLRALRAALKSRFTPKRTVNSPLSWLPPGIGSQVGFVPRNP